jgi:hypothetical protein
MPETFFLKSLHYQAESTLCNLVRSRSLFRREKWCHKNVHLRIPFPLAYLTKLSVKGPGMM